MLLAGCGGGDEEPRTTSGSEPSRELRVETVATGLEVPWEIAFLPDGRALLTERPGRIRLLDASSACARSRSPRCR